MFCAFVTTLLVDYMTVLPGGQMPHLRLRSLSKMLVFLTAVSVALTSCAQSNAEPPRGSPLSGASDLVSGPKLSAPWVCEGGLKRGAMLSEARCHADDSDGSRVMVSAKVYAVPASERADAASLCGESHEKTYAPLFTSVPVVKAEAVNVKVVVTQNRRIRPTSCPRRMESPFRAARLGLHRRGR